MERGRDGADVQAAPRRQMPLWPALHLGRRQLHLGLLLGTANEKLRLNPRKSCFRQPLRIHHQWRLRGQLSPEAAAAGLYRASPGGLVADLSLPCPGSRNAPASDRHRPVQVRRVQAERGDQGCPQTRITGKGRPYLDGNRICDHPVTHLDGGSGVASPESST